MKNIRFCISSFRCLAQDFLFFVFLSVQLRIRVCDLGGLCNVTVATITVRTNRFAPELDSNRYQRTIPETWTVGETVIDVNATDRDIAVSLPRSFSFSFSVSLCLSLPQKERECVFLFVCVSVLTACLCVSLLTLKLTGLMRVIL